MLLDKVGRATAPSTSSASAGASMTEKMRRAPAVDGITRGYTSATFRSGSTSMPKPATRATKSSSTIRLSLPWAPSQPVLYVGRTAKSLGQRVAALYATELGYRRPHPGGHWLKTLHGQSKLRLWWAETDAPG